MFAVCTTGFVQAQDYENIIRSNVVENIGGKDYYLHKVQAGQTLYAISKAYHISVEEILDNNYGLTKELKPGQFIKIPVAPEAKPPANEGVNLRRVAKGETLFGLAQEYHVPVDRIKELNGGLPDGLKEGMLIKIPVAAQPEQNAQQQSPQEKKYFEYQAKNRESLYALALQYRVSIDSIYALNPGIGDELNRDQIIKIPLRKTDKSFITHKVRDRQTLNRLARKYDVDLDKLKKANPYISRHLQQGQVVRIPLPFTGKPLHETIDTLNILEPVDSSRLREKVSKPDQCADMLEMGDYKIALMLPMYFSTYDSIRRAEPQQTSTGFIKPFAFIQFYEGFMMAVDSLQKIGLNARIYVYNVEDDPFQTKQLLRNPELKNMDLIIGPVYSTSFKIVADFAREHQIYIVNPLSNRDEILVGNPYVFKVQPSVNEQYKVLVNYLNNRYEDAQIFIARHNQYRDGLAFDRLKSVLNADLKNRPLPFTTLYHEIIYNRDSLYTFIHNASVDKENVVVTYSENKVFVLDFLRSLNAMRDTFDITVIGMPHWRDMEGLELEYLNNLSTQMFAEDFVDYEDPQVIGFIKKFRAKYDTEPVKYGFDGYDIGFYFLSALMKFGADFGSCIPYYHREMLNLGFNFEQQPDQGFSNTHWFILRMIRFNFRKASGAIPEMHLFPGQED